MRRLHAACFAIVLCVMSGPCASAQSDPARWLETGAARAPADTGGYLKHLDTGREVGVRGSRQAPAVSPEQELEQLERRLVAAIAARDLVTYDQLVADDYVVVSAAGTERTKADVMAGYRAGTQGYRGLEISDVKGHAFGDTGIVHARTLGFRVDGGKETPNRVRYVRVFARRNGRWQAVMQMAQPLPPEQP